MTFRPLYKVKLLTEKGLISSILLDACLYTGEILLLIVWQPLGGFPLNLPHVCSSPGKIF